VKSDRLLSILLLLQTHGRLPAAELAARLEVSVRTIMRDVEALSAAGVPVYAERGRHGGIALLPGYRTDVTGLTADESRALFVLVTGQAHADLGLGQAIGSALRKVMAALPAPYRDAATLTSQRILVDPVRWRSGPWQSSDLGAVLAQLQNAVFTDRRLQLRYRHSQDQRVRSYTLDPYGLVDKAGVWYLVADHHSQPKLFRADRMVAAAVADQPVRRRAGVELADVWQTLRQQIDDIPAGVRVVVRVRRQTLGRFLLVHRAANLASPPPTKPPPGDPDRIELQLDFRNLDAAQSLLAFGPDVEVISPAPLRDDLARTAREVVALYTTGQPS
jgi:predicted DNA-binding transcriptional regulator YafY